MSKQITEYKSVFKMFDEEGNGTVKTQELERLMTSGNISLITCFYVITGKGTFNRESFLALMALIHESARGQHAVLRAAFKVFEKEAEGYIEWNTLKYVLMNVGEPLNELEAEQMMEADKDGDGSFDYEEFVNMMTGGSVKMS
uniref:EF-hand domain-containing protein n=1 Tax=Oncorhynchus tshawytscha TaxID=74940 RepID=A0A8C8BRX3_ONCTS